MQYDFDRVYPRQNTNSIKWDAVREFFGDEDVIPMWVADMDFPTAEPIVEALRKRAEHPFYGYTMSGKGLLTAIVDRLERVFNWRIEPEWIVFSPGVVPAIYTAIRSLTRPGDAVILQEPVYYPFFPSVTQSGCQVATNRLLLENGRYRMDYDDLERQFAPKTGMHDIPSRARVLVLCNPHNPVGRVWTREEITRAGECALAHGATVISDEIHCELLYEGAVHTPFASISDEFAAHSIVCMAPSKTFNLAGLTASSIIIPDRKLRRAYSEMQEGAFTFVNIFGLAAMEAAFRYGDEWLGQVRAYLQKNLEFTLDFFAERIPRIRPIRPEGTYLLWLDCRELGLDDDALRTFMRQKAKVGLDDGCLFGTGGNGFQRMNIACPRTLLESALERIEKAVASL